MKNIASAALCLLCLFGTCLRSPFTRSITVRAVQVGPQDNITVRLRDTHDHYVHWAILPGGDRRSAVPFSGNRPWSFTTTLLGAKTILIDGRPVKVKR